MPHPWKQSPMGYFTPAERACRPSPRYCREWRSRSPSQWLPTSKGPILLSSFSFKILSLPRIHVLYFLAMPGISKYFYHHVLPFASLTPCDTGVMFCDDDAWCQFMQGMVMALLTSAILPQEWESALLSQGEKESSKSKWPSWGDVKWEEKIIVKPSSWWKPLRLCWKTQYSFLVPMWSLQLEPPLLEMTPWILITRVHHWVFLRPSNFLYSIHFYCLAILKKCKEKKSGVLAIYCPVTYCH